MQSIHTCLFYLFICNHNPAQVEKIINTCITLNGYRPQANYVGLCSLSRL